LTVSVNFVFPPAAFSETVKAPAGSVAETEVPAPPVALATARPPERIDNVVDADVPATEAVTAPPEVVNVKDFVLPGDMLPLSVCVVGAGAEVDPVDGVGLGPLDVAVGVGVGPGGGVEDDVGAGLGLGVADGVGDVPVNAANALAAFTRPVATVPPLSGSVVPVIALATSELVAELFADINRPARPATTGDAEDVPPKLKVLPLGATV
jgi:hypothetical protein